MLKRIVSLLCLTFALLFFSPTIADALTICEPTDILYTLSEYSNNDSDGIYQRNYRVNSHEKIAKTILAYLEYVMEQDELEHIDFIKSPNDWYYHCFAPSNGYSYSTYRHTSGDWKTPSGCLFICYMPNNDIFSVSYSSDFSLGKTDMSQESSNSSDSLTGTWEIYSYVDKYNKPTNNYYISTPKRFTGTFSNSAVSNAELEVELWIDDSDVYMRLYKYGLTKVANNTSNFISYQIRILDSNSKEHILYGSIGPNQDFLSMGSKNTETFIETLEANNGAMSIYIERWDGHGSDNYLFSIDNTNGFGFLWSILKIKNAS